MTPEQLDEIEKEARAGGPEDDGAGDIAAFLVDCRILPLVKALREALEVNAKLSLLLKKAVELLSPPIDDEERAFLEETAACLGEREEKLHR